VPVINTNDTDDTDNGAENNTHNTYRMFSGMSLDEIQEFLNEVSQKLTTDDLVYVNLAEADTVSTSIVQAIISLNRFAGHTQKTIKWQNPSAGFSDAFNNLGFYSEMMRLEFA
jgi:anti-anti-sigma regulatory factor